MKTKHMSDAEQNRRAEILSQLMSKRSQVMEAYWARYNDIEQGLLFDAETHGGLAFTELFSEVQTQLEDLGELLKPLGMRIDSGKLAVNADAPDHLPERIRQQVERRIGTKQNADAPYNDALQKLVTLTSLDKLERVIASLA